MGKVEIQVLRDVTGEIGVGDGYGLEFLHVAENDIRARGLDWRGRDCKVGEVMEASEPDTGESSEGVYAGEGEEGGSEFRWEANGGDGAVEEGNGVKGGKGLEGGEGESDVVCGAVGEGEGEKVAEGLGGVAEEGGVVLALAGVLGGRDVEGLQGSELLRVERRG